MAARTSGETIELFTPRMAEEKWREVRPFVRAVVRQAFGLSPCPTTVRSQMVEVTAFVSWAVDQGLPLDVEQIFHPATVNRYVQTMVGYAEMTRSCRRATLTTVSRRITRAAPWEPRREIISTLRMEVPYTDSQTQLLVDCAGQQTTTTRVRVLTGAVALGLGAGLTAQEMIMVTGSEVSVRRSHVLIAVPGSRARLVPVLGRYAPTVRDFARRAGSGRLIVDFAPRTSYVSDVIQRCEIPAALQKVSATRLRLTWEVSMLRAVPFPVFLRLSGHVDGAKMARLAAHLGTTHQSWTAHEMSVITRAVPW